MSWLKQERCSFRWGLIRVMLPGLDFRKTLVEQLSCLPTDGCRGPVPLTSADPPQNNVSLGPLSVRLTLLLFTFTTCIAFLLTLLPPLTESLLSLPPAQEIWTDWSVGKMDLWCTKKINILRWNMDFVSWYLSSFLLPICTSEETNRLKKAVPFGRLTVLNACFQGSIHPISTSITCKYHPTSAPLVIVQQGFRSQHQRHMLSTHTFASVAWVNSPNGSDNFPQPWMKE